MDLMMTSRDILPMSTVKTEFSRILNALAQHQRPLVVTQNGKAAGVLLAPAAYDELMLLAKLGEAYDDIEAGRVYTTDEVRAALAARRRKRADG